MGDQEQEAQTPPEPAPIATETSLGQESTIMSFRQFLPLVIQDHALICRDQTDGSIAGDVNTLYSIVFYDTVGNVRSPESELKLPYIPVTTYAAIQGYDFEILGYARVCSVATHSPHTAFLVDGGNVEEINRDGYHFELDDTTGDYIVEGADYSVQIHIYVKSGNNPGRSYVLVEYSEEYFPYFDFAQHAILQGFPWINVKHDNNLAVTLIGKNPPKRLLRIDSVNLPTEDQE
jgi:hypothetical protein